MQPLSPSLIITIYYTPHVCASASHHAQYASTLPSPYLPQLEGDTSSISDHDRQLVKSHVLDLMCAAPVLVKRQVCASSSAAAAAVAVAAPWYSIWPADHAALSATATNPPQLAESVGFIAQHDFPHAWPNLAHEITARLSTTDMAVMQGMLETADAMCKKFRSSEDTDEMRLALVAAIEGLADPLTKLIQQLIAALKTHAGNAAMLTQLLNAIREILRVFYSLNSVDLPEFFEDNIQLWMQVHAELLGYSAPVLADPDETQQPGPQETMRAAVLENLVLYVQRYDEEFEPYFKDFVQATWPLLSSGGHMNEPRYDGMWQQHPVRRPALHRMPSQTRTL